MKYFLITLSLVFLLCGCGQKETPPTAEIQPEPTIAPVETTPEIPKTPDPISPEDFARYREQYPDMDADTTIKTEAFSFSSKADALDLSGITNSQLQSLLPALEYMEVLSEVELGNTNSSDLQLGDLAPLQTSCPDVTFRFGFELYGKQVNTADESLDFRRVPVDDNGEAVFEAMKYMPKLKYLDMDSCGVSNEDMAKIRDAYPDVKVVWRVWFGDSYTVRTDVETILASKPEVAGILSEDKIDGLKYCTEVRYLDLGHNPDLHTIEFVRYMPKLEVAILAMDFWSDCSPLAGCTELEYLEIQTTKVSDISALAGLTKLKHLNICYLYDLTDISPLYGLTQLERLWIGCITPIPDEQIEKMQSLAPNCVINTSTLDPTEQEWRYSRKGGLVPRYALLREQFGGYSNGAFAFSWNDPLL